MTAASAKKRTTAKKAASSSKKPSQQPPGIQVDVNLVMQGYRNKVDQLTYEIMLKDAMIETLSAELAAARAGD